MKKQRFQKKFFVLLLFVASARFFAQTNYTWMKGSNLIDQPAVYGSIGVPSVNNNPGGRDMASSWTDAAGNFWLFGGFGIDGAGNFGYLNDLWRYSVVNNQWTWIKGDNTTDLDGVYGVLGIPSASTNPGARSGASSWTDAAGNFWLFGGVGWDASSNNGELNDLWKYNTVTNQWTWINGDDNFLQNGTYGPLGTPSASNVPGARYLGNAWGDASGNLWMFGGIGLDGSGNFGDLNDLWKYNISSNQWTWMLGDNTPDQNGVYGTLGTASVTNKPGGRFWASTWKDGSGNFWMFGGVGYDSGANNEDLLNDLWRYNPTTNQWTWVNGSNIGGVSGVYGTSGTPSASNLPGGRLGGVSWNDASGNLYTFGGLGYDASANVDILNDLWKYSIVSNQWTWMKGSNTVAQTGVYGTQGVSAVANTPGARQSAVGWKDNSGNFWLFGGFGNDTSSTQGELNDLWKLGSCASNPIINITASSNTLCAGSSATLSASGALNYQWSTNESGQTVVVTPTANGASIVTSIGTATDGCSASASIAINVFALPNVSASSSKPTICRGEQVQISASGANQYSWNTNPVSTGAVINVSPSLTTVYFVNGFNLNGCSKTFSLTQIVNTCVGLDAVETTQDKYSLYPNPNNGKFIFSSVLISPESRLEIYNTIGQKVFFEDLNSPQKEIQTQLSSGFYHYILLQGERKVSEGKIIIE